MLFLYPFLLWLVKAATPFSRLCFCHNLEVFYNSCKRVHSVEQGAEPLIC